MDYKVTISETSREFTAKEKIQLKDITNAIKLDEAANGGKLIITPVAYAILDVYNEKSDNKEYKNYIILDNEGEKYYTGSNSFWNSFKGIWDEMVGETDEWAIEVYKVDSKNYKGKQFITCSVV